MNTKSGNPSSQAFPSIIYDSLYGDRALFILSAHGTEESSSIQDLLIKTWKSAQNNRTTPHVKDLITTRLSFPWSERPAHALFTGIFELRDLEEWTTMLVNALREGRSRDVTTNTHIADVLEGIARPGGSGTHDFYSKYSFGQHVEILPVCLRSYLLDLTPPASDRSKLRFVRTLTTQDRYELLRCLWQCQQGLVSDLDVRKHNRVWVYLDEAENTLDYAPSERKTLVKGLAHLISQTGHFLTFWLNIANKGTVQEVKKAFGNLWQWLDYDFTDESSLTQLQSVPKNL